MDLSTVLLNVAIGMLWAVAGGISLAIVSPIAIKVFDWMTKDIDEVEELKKGNMAVALILFGVILGISLVVAAAIH
ncbi:MAG: DUF350 domain-containing protein [Candidatus Hydrothermarchaeales archaeon]